VIGYYWQQIKQKVGDWLVVSGARLQNKKKAAGLLVPSPKLVIHRAVYAAGLMTEVSVTDKLNNATRDALVVTVDSTLGGLLPHDPAFNVRKRLDVDYSYGSDTVFHVSRMEPPPGQIGRLVLPEDAEIPRLTKELGIVKEADTLTKLEIRPSSGQVLNASTERGFSHYRMDIYNSGPEMERNVQVRLVSIEPLPISEYFRARADFPYHVRLAHVADAPVDTSTDHDINPGTSKQFELLFFWESSEHRTIVDGIDTKQALSRDARFSIEDKECWHLKYEVSSAMTGIQRPSFLVRCEGNNLVMRRLI
jgi:hypothetical protein